MLGIALLALAAAFALLGLVRIAGVQRRWIGRHWVAMAVGTLAVLLLFRGQFILAVGLAALAAGMILFADRAGARVVHMTPPSVAEARAILGVGPEATAQEIRAAHRAKMTKAHPDRGGSTEEAARLNAAKDLLLKR